VRANQAGIIAVEKKRTEELWHGLNGIEGVAVYGPPPDQPRVGVVTFNIGELDASMAADALFAQYGIACRAGLHCAPLAHRFLGTGGRGAIRFSVGPYNTAEDIMTAVKAVYRISKKGL
jgi:selenocysteine lyase/cysteine desulfurase